MLLHLNEYRYSIFSTSTNYGASPNFVDVSELPRGGFGSLYLVSKKTAEAIKQAGTTKKFAGVVWAGRLWLDIDSYEAAEKVEGRLQQMGLNYVAYDSGHRSAHFGILRRAAPSHLLPVQDKEWVRAHFPEADLSIYTHLHLFRLPGTPHLKTGRKKVLVSRQPGAALVHRPYVGELGEARPSKSFYSLGTSVFESRRIMSNSVPTTNGTRHPTLVKLAYALHDKGVPPEVARWWVAEVNKLAEEPKEDWELDKLVQSIYA